MWQSGTWTVLLRSIVYNNSFNTCHLNHIFGQKINYNVWSVPFLLFSDWFLKQFIWIQIAESCSSVIKYASKHWLSSTPAVFPSHPPFARSCSSGYQWEHWLNVKHWGQWGIFYWTRANSVHNNTAPYLKAPRIKPWRKVALYSKNRKDVWLMKRSCFSKSDQTAFPGGNWRETGKHIKEPGKPWQLFLSFFFAKYKIFTSTEQTTSSTLC